MIQKYGDQVQLVCDQCGEETVPYHEDDFQELVEAAKKDKWKIHRPEGEWKHLCPDCSDGSALDRARRKFGLRP